MTVRQVQDGRHLTVGEVLRAAASAHPGREAYVEPAVATSLDGAEPTPRVRLSFAEWDRAADGVAGSLAHLGVGRGDVVCLVLPSSIDFALAYAGALRLGAVTSAVNPRMGAAELKSVVARSRPAVTVVDRGLAVSLPGGAGTVRDRAWLAEAAAGAPPARPPVVAEDDPVAVVWTSGTTGRPKGAVFDHRCLAAVATGTDALSQPGDRRLSPLPFAHVGYMTRLWDETAHGVTTVITPTPWRATDALRIMAEERITVGQGVPTQWSLMLSLPEFDVTDLSALRVAGTGAARVPAELVAELRRRLGVPVVVRYTSTETSLGTGTRPGDPDEVVAGTVGRPVAGVELRVVDDELAPRPRGAVGRVQLRSAAAMLGYWGDPGGPDGQRPRLGPPDGPVGERAAGAVGATGAATRYLHPEATAAVRSPDGWITTGDFGRQRPDGNLQLVGRVHDVYIRGGYNVYPAEVEDRLAAHRAVARAAVVGTPDPVLGEVGVAFVVPAHERADVPPLAALRAHCAETLADYKAPDALVVVDDLPLTSMMKLDRRALAGPAESAARSRRPGRPPSTPGRPPESARPAVPDRPATKETR